MTHPRHIAILGGGPAGASAALHLARAGFRVAVIDRGAGRGAYGETLPPAVRAALENMGLWAEFASAGHTPLFGNCSCWGSDVVDERDFLYQPYGAGWRIDRAVFDSMLSRAAGAAGAEWFAPARGVQIERRDGGGWRVTLEGAAIEAELLLDASGRASSFARGLGIERRSYDRLIGIGAVLDAAHGFADTRTLVESSAEGWWYSGVIPGGKVAVIFFTDSDLAAARRAADRGGWRDLLEQTERTRQRVACAAPAVRTMAANSSALAQCAGDGWLAAGDAAAAYDPLASQGIVTALWSGELAARAAALYLGGNRGALERYQRMVERAFAIYLHNRSAFYCAERRWSTFDFWRRRAQSVHVAAAIRTETQPEPTWISHP
ncbi:MAG TPA: FAD-dependent oxidoreductase [Bryobacteraceae bacterium]|nr:FAD-dependent oxidoreductase [Bryobacteraceae bacterium]